MNVSYDDPTNTLTIQLSIIEERLFKWVVIKYGLTVVKDMLVDFLKKKKVEFDSDISTAVNTLVTNDPEVIALLKSKGVPL